jgi:hypothetical protein
MAAEPATPGQRAPVAPAGARYLWHRTISTHLYRVFPNLGITSRVELGAALAPAPIAAHAANNGP